MALQAYYKWQLSLVYLENLNRKVQRHPHHFLNEIAIFLHTYLILICSSPRKITPAQLLHLLIRGDSLSATMFPKNLAK